MQEAIAVPSAIDHTQIPSVRACSESRHSSPGMALLFFPSIALPWDDFGYESSDADFLNHLPRPDAYYIDPWALLELVFSPEFGEIAAVIV